jgi:predicted dehydrogenase
MLRAAVIGAKRRRHGIGEYVARSFHEVGAEVAAVVGTSAATAREAAENLRISYGIEAEPFDSVARCLEATAPDVLAICSPHEAHREHLVAAGRAGVHALAEKPMWWPATGDVRAETQRLVRPFADAGRHLMLVTQWPETLAGFRALHAGVADGPVERFDMHLCPPLPGAAMIPDAMPHPLSMVQALIGVGAVESIRGGFRTEDRRTLEIEFDYRHATGVTTVGCRFVVRETPPRPAEYAVNGRWVSREIRLPGYEMVLVAEGRTVPIDDPLPAHVRRFVERAEAGEPFDPAPLVSGMVALREIADAVAEWEDRG